MTSTVSRSRASRSSFAGHGSPVTCSLIASPLPSAAQNRPGYISASVAIVCAAIAGWYRCPGAVTTPSGNRVACERRAEPAPRVAGVALPHAPRGEVVGAHRRVEARLLGALHGVRAVGWAGVVRARRGIPRSSFALLPSSSTLPALGPGRQPLAGRAAVGVPRGRRLGWSAWQNAHPGRSARPSAGSSGRRRSTRTRGTTSSPRSSAPTSDPAVTEEIVDGDQGAGRALSARPIRATCSGCSARSSRSGSRSTTPPSSSPSVRRSCSSSA